MIRFIGILLWSEWQDGSKRKNSKLFQALSEKLKLDCIECGSNIELERADFILFLETGTFLCPKCFYSLINSPNAIKGLDEFVKLLKTLKEPGKKKNGS